MKEYTIKLEYSDLEFIQPMFDLVVESSQCIEDAILAGILQQILDQTKTKQNPGDPEKP